MEVFSTACRRHLSPRSESIATGSGVTSSSTTSSTHAPWAPRKSGLRRPLGYIQQVSASTLSQALNALLFLYHEVLEIEVGHLAGLRRVQRRDRLPVILSFEEVEAVLARLEGLNRLLAELLYGAGLRMTKCMTMQVKGLDFSTNVIEVRPRQQRQAWLTSRTRGATPHPIHLGTRSHHRNSAGSSDDNAPEGALTAYRRFGGTGEPHPTHTGGHVA